jgi:glycosyltransferase involved in cell wall biosynthesis
MRERIPLIYALSTGARYGMQEMAYATAWGLRHEFEPIIFTPPGPAVGEARKLGFEVVETLKLSSNQVGGLTSPQSWALSAQLSRYLSRHRRLAFFGTRCMHNLVFGALNLRYRRRVANIHMVHGVEAEAAYGQKRILDRFPFPITILAVSEFSRERMQAHGLRRRIRVIENYLTDERVAAAPRREPFRQPGVRRAAVVSRLDPVKRVDVLLTCLENRPELNSIAFHIYGDGSESEALKARAAKSGLNIIFEGFRSDVAEQLAKVDLLVHLCPLEALPLALLEAMAAEVPVVAPNRGGTACVVDDGVNGLHFAANDAASLGVCLAGLRQAKPERLNALVAGGRVTLATRFSERERLADYRSLISGSLGEKSKSRCVPG